MRTPACIACRENRLHANRHSARPSVVPQVPDAAPEDSQLQWDTYKVCDWIVKAGAENTVGKQGCRFMDILPEKHVSEKPTFFFSHTWKGGLYQQLTAVVK